MIHLALGVPFHAFSIAVIAGLIILLGAEVIVSQREKKLVPVKVKSTRTTP